MVRTYDELPAVMNAELVAQTLGISRTGAYQLMHPFGSESGCSSQRTS